MARTGRPKGSGRRHPDERFWEKGVTHAENVRRSGAPAATKVRHAKKTHCPKGHELRKRTYSGRTCNECPAQRARARRANAQA